MEGKENNGKTGDEQSKNEKEQVNDKNIEQTNNESGQNKNKEGDSQNEIKTDSIDSKNSKKVEQEGVQNTKKMEQERSYPNTVMVVLVAPSE